MPWAFRMSVSQRRRSYVFFENIENLAKATEESLLQVPEVGMVVASMCINSSVSKITLM